MNAIALLFFVGVILLAAEVFVPGGVLGIIGGLAMAAGCGVALRSWVSREVRSQRWRRLCCSD